MLQRVDAILSEKYSYIFHERWRECKIAGLVFGHTAPSRLLIAHAAWASQFWGTRFSVPPEVTVKNAFAKVAMDAAIPQLKKLRV